MNISNLEYARYHLELYWLNCNSNKNQRRGNHSFIIHSLLPLLPFLHGIQSQKFCKKFTAVLLGKIEFKHLPQIELKNPYDSNLVAYVSRKNVQEFNKKERDETGYKWGPNVLPRIYSKLRLAAAPLSNVIPNPVGKSVFGCDLVINSEYFRVNYV